MNIEFTILYPAYDVLNTLSLTLDETLDFVTPVQSIFYVRLDKSNDSFFKIIPVYYVYNSF